MFDSTIGRGYIALKGFQHPPDKSSRADCPGCKDQKKAYEVYGGLPDSLRKLVPSEFQKSFDIYPRVRDGHKGSPTDQWYTLRHHSSMFLRHMKMLNFFESLNKTAPPDLKEVLGRGTSLFNMVLNFCPPRV